MLKKAIPLLLLLGFELSHGAAANNEIITRVYSWKEGDKQKFGEIPSPDADAELAFTVKNFPAKNENGDTLVWKFKTVESKSCPGTIPRSTRLGITTAIARRHNYIDAYSDEIPQDTLQIIEYLNGQADVYPGTHEHEEREKLLKQISLYAFIEKGSIAHSIWEETNYTWARTKEQVDPIVVVEGFKILEPKPAEPKPAAKSPESLKYGQPTWAASASEPRGSTEPVVESSSKSWADFLNNIRFF